MSTISVEPFWQDVRFVFRNLRKNHGAGCHLELFLAARRETPNR
jgi:hypothetical protein